METVEKRMAIKVLVMICLAFPLFAMDGERDEARFAPEQREVVQLKQTLEQLLSIDAFSLSKQQQGDLWLNIAEIYLQIGADADALAYLLRAEKIFPEDASLKQEIDGAFERIGASRMKVRSAHSPRWEQLLFPLSLATFLLLSFWIWSNVHFWFHVACLVGVVPLGIFLFLLYHAYFAPIQGIVIRPTNVYANQNRLKGPITIDPLSPGDVVEILSVSLKEKQAAILFRNGKWGVVPLETVRVI